MNKDQSQMLAGVSGFSVQCRRGRDGETMDRTGPEQADKKQQERLTLGADCVWTNRDGEDLAECRLNLAWIESRYRHLK